MKIGFIGCGNMATAMLKGILKCGEVKKDDMIASAKSDRTREKIEKELGIEIVGDTKVKIAIEETEEQWDDIFDDVDENTEKEIEDNIDPNYIKEEK